VLQPKRQQLQSLRAHNRTSHNRGSHNKNCHNRQEPTTEQVTTETATTKIVTTEEPTTEQVTTETITTKTVATEEPTTEQVTTETATTTGTRTSVKNCYAFLETCFRAPDSCSLLDPIEKLFDCLLYPHIPANCYRCDEAVMAIFSAEIESLQFCNCSEIASIEGPSQDIIKYLCFVSQTCDFSIPISTQEAEISTPSTSSLKVPTGTIPQDATSETIETSTPTTEATTIGKHTERCLPLIPEYAICRSQAIDGGYQFRIV
jgi:hypothetical protein